MGVFAKRKRQHPSRVGASPRQLGKRGAVSSAGRVGTSQHTRNLVGPVTESRADHLRRHNGFMHAKCPRCNFYRNDGRWCSSYATVEDPRCKADSRGQVAVAEWLAERPAHLGGHWALGCRICVRAAERLWPEVFVNARGKWSRYEALPVYVHTQLKKHGDTDVHREAVKMLKMLLQPIPAEASGFVTWGSAPTGTLATSVGTRSLSEDSVADGKARPHAAFYQQRVGQAC